MRLVPVDSNTIPLFGLFILWAYCVRIIVETFSHCISPVALIIIHALNTLETLLGAGSFVTWLTHLVQT